MRTSSGPGGQSFPTDRSPPTPPGQTAPDQRDIQAKKFKVLSQDLDDPNRRSVQIEKYLHDNSPQGVDVSLLSHPGQHI